MNATYNPSGDRLDDREQAHLPLRSPQIPVRLLPTVATVHKLDDWLSQV